MSRGLRKQEFLKAFNEYIETYIFDSFQYDILKLEFFHATKPVGCQNTPIDGFENIKIRYHKPERLFSGAWQYVDFINHEQFIHELHGGIYTLNKCDIPKGMPLQKILVPKIFVKKATQDTIYYI